MFAQYLEDEAVSSLLGKTVTISAVVNGTLYVQTGTLPDTLPTTKTYYLESLNLNINGGGLFRFWMDDKLASKVDFYIPPGSAYTISYVKLEIGDHATAFSPRPYAQELAMCQRYCYRMSGINSLFSGYMHSDSVGRFCVNLPTNLRTTPTITYADSGNGTGVDVMQCVVAEAYQTPTSIYVLENGAANVTLSLGLTGSIRELAIMRFLQYVIFDAEIYT